MSLHAPLAYAIPEQTAHVARAAFPAPLLLFDRSYAVGDTAADQAADRERSSGYDRRRSRYYAIRSSASVSAPRSASAHRV